MYVVCKINVLTRVICIDKRYFPPCTFNVLTSGIFPHHVVCKINVLTCYPSHKRDNRDIRGHDHILVCIWQIGLVSVLDETLHIKILYIFFTPNVFSYCYVNKASKVFKFCVFPAMMDHITPVYFDLGVNSFISLEGKDNINTGILVNSIIVNSKPTWKY